LPSATAEVASALAEVPMATALAAVTLALVPKARPEVAPARTAAPLPRATAEAASALAELPIATVSVWVALALMPMAALLAPEALVALLPTWKWLARIDVVEFVYAASPIVMFAWLAMSALPTK
jgi:hypothetical protein